MDDFFIDYKNLKVWGCHVTCHIPQRVRQRGEKFSPRSETGRLVGYESPDQYKVLLDATKQVMVHSGAQMVFNEASNDQLAAKDQSTKILLDEASDDQSITKNQLTFEEKEMGDTIVLEPLPGRTPLATTSYASRMSKDAIQSTEPGIGLEREPRHITQIATPSQEPRMSKDAIQNDQQGMSLEQDITRLTTKSETPQIGQIQSAIESAKPGVGSKLQEDNESTIYVSQPVKQPGGREQQPQPAPPPEPGRSSQRARKAPDRFGWLSVALAGLLNDTEDPVTRTEALSAYDSSDWKAAKQREIQSLNDHNTWTVIDRKELPIGARVLGGKFVYRRKRGSSGKILKHKAR